MKKTLLLAFATVFALAFTLCLCACSSKASSTTEAQSSKSVTESTYVNIDGIYVDDSYKDEKSDDLKLLYVFYTVHTSDKNINAYSKQMKMTIGSNEYESEHYKNACDNMPSFYYSDYIKTVYVGNELKVVDTFEIPEGDLTEGKEISLEATRYPDLDKLKLNTSDIKHCANAADIAKEVDQEGFAAAQEAREPADADTTAQVSDAINGYYWDFYVNYTSYRIEFYAPNAFELQRPVSNAGTYEVLNNYIRLTYDSNDATVDIPYSWKDSGEIELDIASGFDVSEG